MRHMQQPPPDGNTYWSCRKLAKAEGVSKSTVQRVGAQARLKPHRVDRYMASDDPEFENKAAEIIGLHLSPPQHAAVFCVDGTTSIQAMDRLEPVLPLWPGRAEHRGFEHFRLGALSLYAALDVKTGRTRSNLNYQESARRDRSRRLCFSQRSYPETAPLYPRIREISMSLPLNLH